MKKKILIVLGCLALVPVLAIARSWRSGSRPMDAGRRRPRELSVLSRRLLRVRNTDICGGCLVDAGLDATVAALCGVESPGRRPRRCAPSSHARAALPLRGCCPVRERPLSSPRRRPAMIRATVALREFGKVRVPSCRCPLALEHSPQSRRGADSLDDAAVTGATPDIAGQRDVPFKEVSSPAIPDAKKDGCGRAVLVSEIALESLVSSGRVPGVHHNRRRSLRVRRDAKWKLGRLLAVM